MSVLGPAAKGSKGQEGHAGSGPGPLWRFGLVSQSFPSFVGQIRLPGEAGEAVGGTRGRSSPSHDIILSTGVHYMCKAICGDYLIEASALPCEEGLPSPLR